jgi:hypothetical protein
MRWLLFLVLVGACSHPYDPLVDRSCSGLATLESETTDIAQTCDGACPANLRGGGIPGDPCETSTDCAQLCCDCPGDAYTTGFAAAACVHGRCSGDSSCAAALDEADKDACPTP